MWSCLDRQREMGTVTGRMLILWHSLCVSGYGEVLTGILQSKIMFRLKLNPFSHVVLRLRFMYLCFVKSTLLDLW